MSENLNDSSFFSDAYHIIYDWLTDEEKLQFNIELLNDEIEFSDLSNRLRFLKIIRFIQVKYVNLEKYTTDMLSNFSKITDDRQSYDIEDIVLGDDTKYSVLNLYNAILEEKLIESFQQMLKDIGVLTEYEGYLNSLKTIRGDRK